MRELIKGDNVGIAYMEYKRVYYMYEYAISIKASIDNDEPMYIEFTDTENTVSNINNDKQVEIAVNNTKELIAIFEDFDREFNKVKELYLKENGKTRESSALSEEHREDKSKA